jgi:type VI protein secretion system component Hcp
MPIVIWPISGIIFLLEPNEMKTVLILIIAFLTPLFLNAQTQDFKVNKQGLEFPDGKLQANAWPGNEVANPSLDNVKIFAQIDGIEGDVLVAGFQDHVEFYNLNFLLKAKLGGEANWPIADPINKYFEVYKQVDKASVALVQKFTMGHFIGEIKFKFVMMSATVTELYRVTVINTKIRDFELAYQYVEGGAPILFEKYTFFMEEMTYENISEFQGVNLIISGNE